MRTTKMPGDAGELGRFMSVARVAAGGGVAVQRFAAAAGRKQADRALLRSDPDRRGGCHHNGRIVKMAGVISD
ncbi:hypothetical protein D4M24_12205 [Escherichia coli]|nr:hypothetical protein D4M24_12205 [Escherichia coli]